mmetsp:Transcript_26061/g.65693  ORF Transcript_26061/g.65693 Transcript_26061/m.65693 type:complete len:892 (+) Transcript_26061:527-3202(+)
MELPTVGDHNRSSISPSPSVLAGGSLASKPTANLVASSSRATNTTTATEHEVANSQSLGTDIRMTSSIQHQQLQQAEDLQQQAEKLQQQAAAMQQQAAEIHKQMQKNRAANANGQSVPAAASQQTSSSAKPVPAAADPQMPQRDIVMKPLTQQVVQGSLQVGQSVSSVSSDRRQSEAMPGVPTGGPILGGSSSNNAAAPPILPSSSAAGSATSEVVQRSQAPTTSLVVEPAGSAAAAGGGDGLVDKHIQGSPIELKSERRRRRSESSSSSQPKDKAAISVSDEKIISELKQGLPGGAVSTSLKDFRQMALLGEGAYSAVYKILRLSDNKIYALKKVKLPNLSEKEKQNSLNEVRLLASIQHENVIGYKESFYDDASRCLCIITEYADGGDLFQKISHHQKMRTFFREADVWHCTFGMCHGLKALHELKILHRDLKCANVFLGSKGEVKLGDLNVSKVAKRGLCMTQTGTPYYASPEVWRDMPYDAKSDMWSLGCVIYEMVALRPPFRADDMESLYRKILRGQYPRVPSVYSRDVNEVIALLLQVNPRQRPAVDVLLQLPVMQRHIHYDSASRKGGPRNVPTDLLNTIKMPKDANMSEVAGQMPRARYEDAIPEEPALEKDGYHSGRNRSSRRAKDALDQLRYNLDNNNQDGADKRTNRLDSQSENHNQRGGHIDNQQHGVYPGPYRHTPQPHNPRREHSGARGGVPGSLLVPNGGDRDRAQRYDALKARPDAASRNYSYESRVGGGGIGVNAGPGGHYSGSSHHQQVGVVGEVGGGRSGSGAQQYSGVSGGAQIGGQQYSVNGHPGHHSSAASNSQSHHSHHHHRHGSGSGVKVPSGYNHHVVVDHRAAKPNNGRYGGNRVGRHASGGSKLVHIGRNEGYRPGQLAPMRVF